MAALLASSGSEDPEARASMQLRLRARGVRDLQILRALERVSRASFLPERLAPLAARDVAVPIACGRAVPPAWLVARMAEALELEATHRVLVVGVGHGYTAAVLAQLAREVVATERHRTLAREAVGRLQGAKVDNAAVVFADGLNPPPTLGLFDRVLIEGCVAGLTRELLAAVVGSAVIVMGQRDPEHADRQRLIGLKREEGGPWRDAIVCACRLPHMPPGVAEVL